MATSYNGHRVGTRDELGIESFKVPGSRVQLALLPSTAPALLWVAEQVDARVANIDVAKAHRTPDDWGYAYRETRGASTWSNHASGTADDLNATQWPRGVRRMTAKQVKECRKIRAEINEAAGMRLVDWGGDYQVSPVDQMHWEIASGVTGADVKRAMAVLEHKPKPMPPTLRLHGPAKPHYTRLAQEKLGLEQTGVFDRPMRRRVIRYRKNNHLGRPLGWVGPKLWKKWGVA